MNKISYELIGQLSSKITIKEYISKYEEISHINKKVT